MNRNCMVLCVGFIASMLTACATAPSPGETIIEPEVLQSNTITSNSKIVGIDYPSRTLTISRAGQQVTLVASPRVSNFEQLRVGDLVSTEYTESFAVRVQASEGSARIENREQLDMSKEGTEPSISASEVTEVIADILVIDKVNQTVTLKGPTGGEFTLPVRRHPEHLERVEVGDQVVVTYKKAVAISVTQQP
ncbi:hypothetical protein [Echinimonas agarilytica]|uniref:DUF5666 domain-containing protein n=1 Tax=Echinimonas agarilytica TaxID=1215918 RepID=A0AA41W503_9GAMM|nr:hypothetical protein [Echinimonas agarilytica]MCM2678903.1 hypothetical protein [Echinimonas agarilytica]